MQSLNKKGISNVIATVVLIALSVVAVLLIVAPVNNILLAPSIYEEKSCLDMQLDQTIKIKEACLNSPDIELTIERDLSQTQIASITFLLSGEKTETWFCNEDCPNSEILGIGQIKTYYLSPDNSPIDKKLTILIGDCQIDSATINNCKR